MNRSSSSIFSIEPDRVIEAGVRGGVIVSADQQFVAVIPREQAGNKIEIFRDATKISEFEVRLSPHASWQFAQSHEILVSTEQSQICFWSFDGKLVHSVQFSATTEPDTSFISSCFNRQGDFFCLAPQTTHMDSFEVAVWTADTPLERLGRWEHASDVQKFDVGTGGCIYGTKRNERIFTVQGDGHGGEPLMFDTSVESERIVLKEAFGERMIFRDCCCWPCETSIAVVEGCPTAVRIFSLPGYQPKPQKLVWPFHPGDVNYDIDCMSSCDFVNDDLLAIQTEHGRLHLISTKSMQLVGELETPRFPLQPDTFNPNIPLKSPLGDIWRYRDKHLMVAYNTYLWQKSKNPTTLAFLPVDAIAQAVGENSR